MSPNIYWCYRNLVEKATTITESSGTAGDGGTNFGTANIKDYDLNTSFRSNTDKGTTTITLDFGSAVYVDSFIAVHNLPSEGTCLLRGGASKPPTDVTISAPIVAKGTSVKYTTASGYRYWEVSLGGTTAGGYHELFELFLGKRMELDENPTYPLRVTDVEDVVENLTERGQKYVYSNYSRRTWQLNYEAIPQASYDKLITMKSYVSGSYKPLWFCIDPGNNPEETYFVRLAQREFTFDELISNIWNVSFVVEQEL